MRCPGRRRPGSVDTRHGCGARPGAEPVSRPLSDPDLTPLMGIPIIRPVAVDAPAAPVAVPEMPHAPEPAVPDVAPVEFPGPSPRVTDTLVADDDVVFLQPSDPPGRSRSSRRDRLR